MSLSGKPLKEQVSTLQVLLDMAEGFKALSDPREIKQLIEESRLRGEEEDRKAAQAREGVKQHLEIAAKNKQEFAQIEKEKNDIQLNRSDIAQKKQELAEKEAFLNKRQTSLDGVEKEQSARKEALDKKEVELKEGQRLLSEERIFVNSELKKAQDLQEKLKRKEEQALAALRG